MVDDYYLLSGARSAWPVIRAALATPSRLAVIPMQDLLDLPASANWRNSGGTTYLIGFLPRPTVVQGCNRLGLPAP